MEHVSSRPCFSFGQAAHLKCLAEMPLKSLKLKTPKQTASKTRVEAQTHAPRRSGRPDQEVHRAKLFGRCEVKSGIAPTHRLIAEVMSQESYQSANRVFWIIRTTARRIAARKPSSAFPSIGRTSSRCAPRFTPVDSTKSRFTSPSCNSKALTPNDFSSLAQFQRLLDLQKRYEQTASSVWSFTRYDLGLLLAKLQRKAHSRAQPPTLWRLFCPGTAPPRSLPPPLANGPPTQTCHRNCEQECLAKFSMIRAHDGS
jgi:hypothetical protein